MYILDGTRISETNISNAFFKYGG